MGTDPHRLERLTASIREFVVTLYLDGVIGFPVMVAVLGRDDAHMVRTAAAVLDDGEALASDLAEL